MVLVSKTNNKLKIIMNARFNQVLNLRTAEKQVGFIQHQSKQGNCALILAYLMHQHCLGISAVETMEIKNAMGKCYLSVHKYLHYLLKKKMIARVVAENDLRVSLWYIPEHCNIFS